jgi:phosphoribosylanthranilate isomerase
LKFLAFRRIYASGKLPPLFLRIYLRTRVKICGITRVEDAYAVARAGADAIGLVFHEGSPRCVSVKKACAITAALPPYITVVGLFVDEVANHVAHVLSQVNLNLLQFHGNETPEQCRRFGRPYVKALRMRDDIDLHARAREFEDAAGLLLDAFVPGEPGGSGRTFDWTRVPSDIAKPLVLAGGLTPVNVGQAVAVVRPFAVDVSSGVERSKGIKDPELIAEFMQAVSSVVR